MFFKSYTEKVWGCPCTEIGADWAAQRIKGLSLGEAVRHSIFGQRRGSAVKTLIDEFKYPPRGAGHVWESCAQIIKQRGWEFKMQTSVSRLTLTGNRITSIDTRDNAGKQSTHEVNQVFSSMPLRQLLESMQPAPPPRVLEAARSLHYRDFLIVALVINGKDLFPDNWIYVHAPEVRVGRIDNFANWTPQMQPNRDTTCLTMEYFVFEDDEIWSKQDEELVDMAYKELQQIGLAKGDLLLSRVVRVKKAYPMYDPGYSERLSCLREWITENVKNLSCIGRNGQHRYNNQDHSMATALIAARNLALGQSRDPWAVNEDAEYHEIAKTERYVPILPTMVPQTKPAV